MARVKLRCIKGYPGFKSSYREKSLVLHSCHLRWNSYLKSLILNSCTFSIFPALEIKKLVLAGKLMWRFDKVFHIWLKHLLFVVMINILYEMNQILHEKMLNAVYLHWYHNDTSAENNSLNGHSNEPWINDKWIEVRHTSCQVKCSWYV